MNAIVIRGYREGQRKQRTAENVAGSLLSKARVDKPRYTKQVYDVGHSVISPAKYPLDAGIVYLSYLIQRRCPLPDVFSR